MNVELTAKQVEALKHMCDSWVPSTPKAMPTKAEDKMCDSIMVALVAAEREMRPGHYKNGQGF